MLFYSVLGDGTMLIAETCSVSNFGTCFVGESRVIPMKAVIPTETGVRGELI